MHTPDTPVHSFVHGYPMLKSKPAIQLVDEIRLDVTNAVVCRSPFEIYEELLDMVDAIVPVSLIWIIYDVDEEPMQYDLCLEWIRGMFLPPISAVEDMGDRYTISAIHRQIEPSLYIAFRIRHLRGVRIRGTVLLNDAVNAGHQNIDVFMQEIECIP